MGTAMIFQQMLVIFLLILIGYWALQERAPDRIRDPGHIGPGGQCHKSGASYFQRNGAGCGGYPQGYTGDGAGVCRCLRGSVDSGRASVPIFWAGAGKRENFITLCWSTRMWDSSGIPVVSAVLGPEGLLYLVIFNLFFNFLFYTHGLHVLTAWKGTAEKRKSPGVHL